MHRAMTFMLLAVLAILGGAAAGFADVAARTTDPLAPAPASEDCTIAARPREFFEPFVGRDPAMPASPAQIEHLTPYPLPTGRPTDPATVAEVEAAIRMGVACLNALDFPRLFAVHSDNYLERALTANPPTPEGLEMLFSPAAPLPPALREAIVAIGDDRLLPDGRVAAVYISDEVRAAPGYEYHLLIFVRKDGRLRIDADHKTYLGRGA